MKRVSTASNWRLDARVVIAVVALIAVGFYLIVSALVFRIGFPLDDTWIHLTYARNFAEHGEWAFRLGERSAGSTSPLWTFMLSIGFFLNLAPYAWTFFLGWVVLAFLGIYAENIARRFIESYRPRIPWVGLFFVLEWHMTWSAVSGMETLLHGLIILVVLAELMSGSRRYLAMGLLAGLSVWVRPDGLTLVGPLLLTAIMSETTWSARGRAISKVLIGFGALFLLYLLFNLALSGSPMPNTFYAKQAEYQVFWLSKPWTVRAGDYLTVMIASPLLAIIPGVFLWLGKRMTLARNWGAFSGMIWAIGYFLIYFMRLPAYQHGRYIIPLLPILCLWGMLGMLEYITTPRANKRVVFIWQTITAILCVAFVFVAARQNAEDVFWIESEMVLTARWVQQNLPADALLAVHDIGALGYHAQNPILDMAGLITPDVVVFIRDETKLAGFLDSESVDYLIVFPRDYPQLTSQLTPVFVGGMDIAPLPLRERLQVFRWK